ncbi:MAG: peroxiredoxin family protein [Nocardioidaceae bacterium]
MTTPWVIAFCALTAAVGVQMLFTLGLGKRLLVALEAERSTRQSPDVGLPIGVLAPPLTGVDSQREGIELLGRNTVLVFVDDHCGPCRALLFDLASRQPDLRGMQLVLAFDADHDLTQPVPIDAVALSRDVVTTQRWQAYATPQAYVIGVDGRIAASETVNTAAELTNLVRHVWPDVETNSHPRDPDSRRSPRLQRSQP